MFEQFVEKKLDENIIFLCPSNKEILSELGEILKEQFFKKYNFIIVDITTLDKVKYAKKFIPFGLIKSSIELFYKTNIKIILLDTGEGQSYKKELKFFCDHLNETFKINYSDVIILNANLDKTDEKVKKCTIMYIAFPPHLRLTSFDIDTLPTHHFISLARTARNHRISATVKILEKNLESYGYLSCGSISENNSIDKTIIPEKFHSRFPIYLDGVVNSLSKIYSNNEKINRAFVNFVLETGFETNEKWSVPMITEKTTRAFVYGQVPIFVIYKNTLEFVRSLGFDLFDDIIDHSYDFESEPEIRINLAVNQLEKICAKPIEYWVNYKKNNIERFIKNKEIFDKLQNGLYLKMFKDDLIKALQ